MQTDAKLAALLLAAVLALAAPACGDDSPRSAEPNGTMTISPDKVRPGGQLEVTFSQSTSRSDAYILYAYRHRGDDQRSCFGWHAVYVLFSDRSGRDPSTQRFYDNSCVNKSYWGGLPESAGLTSDSDLFSSATVAVSDTGPDVLILPPDVVLSKLIAIAPTIPDGQPYRLCPRQKSGATNVCAELLIYGDAKVPELIQTGAGSPTTTR
jgi:hypothetical protein